MFILEFDTSSKNASFDLNSFPLFVTELKNKGFKTKKVINYLSAKFNELKKSLYKSFTVTPNVKIQFDISELKETKFDYIEFDLKINVFNNKGLTVDILSNTYNCLLLKTMENQSHINLLFTKNNEEKINIEYKYKNNKINVFYIPFLTKSDYSNNYDLSEEGYLSDNLKINYFVYYKFDSFPNVIENNILTKEEFKLKTKFLQTQLGKINIEGDTNFNVKMDIDVDNDKYNFSIDISLRNNCSDTYNLINRNSFIINNSELFELLNLSFEYNIPEYKKDIERFKNINFKEFLLNNFENIHEVLNSDINIIYDKFSNMGEKYLIYKIKRNFFKISLYKEIENKFYHFTKSVLSNDFFKLKDEHNFLILNYNNEETNNRNSLLILEKKGDIKIFEFKYMDFSTIEKYKLVTSEKIFLTYSKENNNFSLTDINSDFIEIDINDFLNLIKNNVDSNNFRTIEQSLYFIKTSSNIKNIEMKKLLKENKKVIFNF